MSAQKLYNGQVELAFDGKKHIYTVCEDGGAPVRVPSVTQALGVIDKSRAMMFWAAGCAAEYLAERLEPGRAYDEIEIAELTEAARYAHCRESRAARTIGSLVHGYLEKLLLWRTGKIQEMPALPVNDQAVTAIEAGTEWMRTHRFEPQSVELRLYSRRHGFAGTADSPGWVARVVDSLAVVDWKSSKALYPEHRMQLAAYAVAASEMTGQEIRERWLVRLGQGTGKPEPAHLPAEDLEKDFNAFLAAKQLWERLEEMKAC